MISDNIWQARGVCVVCVRVDRESVSLTSAEDGGGYAASPLPRLNEKLASTFY